jgi:hypothetical protein
MDPLTNQVADEKNVFPRLSWLYKISGAAALLAGVLLLIGMIRLIASDLQPGSMNIWSSLLRDNWLVLIFKLHAEFSDAQADLLHRLNLLDMVFLVVVGFLCFSLSTVFKKSRKAWSLVAFALSLVGLLLFIATKTAGRSTVMLAVLILSLVMLGNEIFGKIIVYAGILASIFLFAGDISVGIQSSIITILFGIGYVLLIMWFFLIARVFLRLGSEASKEKVN